MYALFLLAFCDFYLAWVAMARYDLGLFSTFFELLSGPMALNWGLPPAEPLSWAGYLFASACASIWALGYGKEIAGLRGFATILWFLFGVLGTFYYAA